MQRASTQSSILVGGDESMESSDCHERTQMKTSWTNKKLEGIFSSRASFFVMLNFLSLIMLSSEVHNLIRTNFFLLPAGKYVISFCAMV